MSAAPQRVERLRSTTPEPRRPKLREAPTAARRGRAGWLGVGAILSIMVVVFGAAALQTLIIQEQVRMDELQRALEQERGTEADLMLEVTSLEAPGRILAEASRQVAMVPPSHREFLAPIVPGNRNVPLDPPADDPFPGSDRAGPAAAEAAAPDGEAP